MLRRMPRDAPSQFPRPEPGRCATGIDLLAALRGVGLAEQSVRRGGEVGVPVPGVAVGEGKLERFHKMVDERRRIPAHGAQVVPLEDVQGLQQHRSLRPESGLVDFVAKEIGAERPLDREPECREVLIPQKASLLLHEGRDPPGDGTAVEVVPNRFDGGFPFRAASQRGPLGPHHLAQGPFQVGLPEEFAGPRHMAVWQVDLPRCREQFQETPGLGDRTRARLVQRMRRREARGRLGGFAERQRSETLQRQQRSVHHPRNESREGAVGRNPARLVLPLGRFLLQTRIGFQLQEEFARHAARRLAHARDAMHIAIGGPDQQGRFAAEAVMGELRHRPREKRGDSRVDGIAAAREDLHDGLRDQRRAGRHSGASAPHDGPEEFPTQDFTLPPGLLGTAAPPLREGHAGGHQADCDRPSDAFLRPHAQPLSS